MEDEEEDPIELYYDEIANIGYLGNSIDWKPIYESEGSTIAHGTALFIQRKDKDERIVLPPLKPADLDKILAYVKMRMAAGDIAPHAPSIQPISFSFSGEYQQTEFKSDEDPFYTSIVITGCCLLFTLMFLWRSIKYGRDNDIGLCLGFGLFTAIGIYFANSFYSSYKEILIYDDRFTIIGRKKEIKQEVYFSDIRYIGTLHGPTVVRHAGDTYGAQWRDLVILLNDGSRVDITQDDISDIRELQSVLSQKVAEIG
jgi:hypothetical protein